MQALTAPNLRRRAGLNSLRMHDDSQQPDLLAPKTGAWRSAVFGTCALALMIGATVWMQAAVGAAQLNVDADPLAEIVIRHGEVRLLPEGGGVEHVLRLGVHGVKAGAYRVQVRSDTARLEFSCGESLTIAAGQTLSLHVTGHPLAAADD
ncbi:MAG: hypothetical protein KDA41_02080 [Planctomycetales bacterium]|nr:hypothetical protein [Planctomycetales bacterium]